MQEVRVGSSLQYFQILPHQWERVLATFPSQDTDKVGEGREELSSFLLQLFEVEVINTKKGSRLDLEGIDLILRLKKGDVLIQVKSSPFGVSEFIKKRPLLSEQILIIWVNSKESSSRRRLFKLLVPILLSLGCCLKPEVRNALKYHEGLKKKGVKNLPLVKGRVLGINDNQMDYLIRMGFIELKGGAYVLM